MKTRIFLIIIPVITLALALAGGFTLLWRFLIFLAVVLLASYLWPRLSLRAIEGKVNINSEGCQVGDGLEEEFTVTNRSRLPTPVIELEEDTDLPGHRNVTAVSLWSRDSYRWQSRADCRQRGKYRLGALTARITDPLGFFPLRRRLGKRRDVIIYPAAPDLPFFRALPHPSFPPGPGRRLLSETGPNASRVRDYNSSDSLRHVHWHTTAHTGRLMVKEYEPDRSDYAFRDVWIVLDMYRGSRRGEGDETTEEYGITTAASLARKYSHAGKRVGLIASGDRPYTFLPEAGDRHLQHMRQALALMRAAGDVPIDGLLASEAGRFGAGSVVFVITTSDNRGIAGPLRRAVNRGAMVTVILLDSLSFGGDTGASRPARGLVAGGIAVYVIRRGVPIARALDSRLASSRLPYVGDKV
ncbi:MAG TPA: DUF58 domain-containing protein [Dehalococcoidales bacterium]|nr:DUF58 domain-containing protein [Dehalococcoidales bacterium]